MEELHRLMTAIMWSSKIIVSVNNENDMQSSTYHRQDEQQDLHGDLNPNQINLFLSPPQLIHQVLS